MKRLFLIFLTFLSILCFHENKAYSIISSLDNGIHKDLLWSILICTLEERKECFNKLYTKLLEQVKRYKLEDYIEIMYFRDNRELSIGLKRNELLKASKGKYVNFIDDDDDIHEEYIRIIYDKLKCGPDCVSLRGIITFGGICPKLFIHSLHYKSYFEKDGIFYRPPNHLNPMKRDIAIQCKFPETNYAEDTDWAMQIAASGLLKKEEIITIPYYFYLFNSTKNAFEIREK